MKKIAITGHSRGIGKHLFDKFNPNTVGFSLSNGFDILLPEHRAQIIELSKDCDVFINNAHASYAQTDMLIELFDVWKDDKKLIINIGSDATNGIKVDVHRYTFEKAALDKASKQLSLSKSKCRVTNLRLGWVGNERIMKTFNPQSVITLDDVYDIISFIINSSSKFRACELSISPL